MHMELIDWLILGIPFLVVLFVGFSAKKYVKGVSDFLAASRCAGRYLLTTADGIAGMGLISMVAIFEQYYTSGYAFGWWGMLTAPITLLITLTGYMIYRYRETRVMTLAQFFEVRYSKRFRLFTGFLIALSGILNYGIFPAVGGRFIIYYCGLPTGVPLFGVEIPTLAILMAVFLSVALSITLIGGQLTTMITDVVQGLFTNIMIVIIAFYLVFTFGFDIMVDTLKVRPSGQSFLDPFDTFKLQDFNIWFVLIGIFGSVYSMMAWQGNQGYNCAAKNAHEAKMSKILGSWRGASQTAMLMLLATCAYVYMHNPIYATKAAEVNQVLQTIDSEALQTQMTVPVAISKMLPPGFTGIFAAIALFYLISTDTTYLHSWGTIIIQDCILPFRKKPFTPKQHLWLLRGSITFVAMFGFWFSLLFDQKSYILMFFALTGAIWLGGAGAVITGGMYWKKGTTPAAWVALIVGSSLAIMGIVLDQMWEMIWPSIHQWFPHWQFLVENKTKFPINGQWMWFISMVASIISYVVVSLLTCKEDFNMDRMLHRGKYAIKDKEAMIHIEKPPRSLKRLVGIDENFTKGDRILSYSVFWYTIYGLVIWAGITLWNVLFYRWPIEWWGYYTFYYGIPLNLIIGLVTTIWFTWGGLIDLRQLFRDLKTIERNEFDTGMVLGHQNLDEIMKGDKIAPECQPEPLQVEGSALPDPRVSSVNLSPEESDK